jgi:hypothetical protein
LQCKAGKSLQCRPAKGLQQSEERRQHSAHMYCELITGRLSRIGGTWYHLAAWGCQHNCQHLSAMATNKHAFVKLLWYTTSLTLGRQTAAIQGPEQAHAQLLCVKTAITSMLRCCRLRSITKPATNPFCSIKPTQQTPSIPLGPLHSTQKHARSVPLPAHVTHNHGGTGITSIHPLPSNEQHICSFTNHTLTATSSSSETRLSQQLNQQHICCVPHLPTAAVRSTAHPSQSNQTSNTSALCHTFSQQLYACSSTPLLLLQSNQQHIRPVPHLLTAAVHAQHCTPLPKQSNQQHIRPVPHLLTAAVRVQQYTTPTAAIKPATHPPCATPSHSSCTRAAVHHPSHSNHTSNTSALCRTFTAAVRAQHCTPLPQQSHQQHIRPVPHLHSSCTRAALHTPPTAITPATHPPCAAPSHSSCTRAALHTPPTAITPATHPPCATPSQQLYAAAQHSLDSHGCPSDPTSPCTPSCETQSPATQRPYL